ncbi:MAG: ABC transporter permease [Actinomycetota bacterium]|nr:ABC transporter permease [Actinomycetota bacterium]
MSSPLAVQVGVLARRSVVRTVRQPASIVPALLFPLFLLAVNTGGLNAATRLPGFPSDSYLDFALAFSFVQGAVFTTTNAGTDLARDIDTGFLNRLALTPVGTIALLAGQLAGVLALALVQALVYLSVGLALGVSIAAGVPGGLVILALALLVALAFGGIGAFLALRFRSGEAVQGLFPVLFVFLFLSSMALPRDLIEIDWFRTVATYNPVSYFIEGIRSLIVAGWDGQALALGFGLALGLVVVSFSAASVALTSWMERT